MASCNVNRNIGTLGGVVFCWAASDAVASNAASKHLKKLRIETSNRRMILSGGHIPVSRW
jgi:hypothetical protein